MALPRKGRRQIAVAGDRYYWAVSDWHNPSTNPYDLNLFVEHSEHPVSLLCVSFDAPYSQWVWGFPDHTIAVTPAVVRQVIEYALLHGWAPTSASGAFTISDAQHLFPDAILTASDFSPDPDGVLRGFTVPRFHQKRT